MVRDFKQRGFCGMTVQAEGEMAMRPDETTEPITIRTAKDVVRGIDALALTTHQSRDEIVEQALRHNLDANTWQLARIEEGLAAAHEGRVRPAEVVLAEIATKRGYKR
jgi:predicted transcriptional regulator